eukprot:GHUV01049226.1.p1 GENE.GHUV01049226.1~~GHUV01049226.1.p1  ORF type:complete len:130 (-),score=19.24 GHUV01049226.1:59-448(-)
MPRIPTASSGHVQLCKQHSWPKQIHIVQGINRLLLFATFSAVWDNMRRIAAGRYKDGLMPPWFKPEWLDIEEAPTNTWWRNHGLSAYRTDTTWLGENAPSTSSGGGSSGGEYAVLTSLSIVKVSTCLTT